MSHHTKLDENLKGDDNFRAWNYRISLVLEENELDSYIHEEVLVPEGDEAKTLHKNKLVFSKRIISNSIKDHFIPHVSSLKTPKVMFDALTKLFEGKNINQKNDFEEPVEECEDPECRDHTVILHKGLPHQRKT